MVAVSTYDTGQELRSLTAGWILDSDIADRWTKAHFRAVPDELSEDLLDALARALIQTSSETIAYRWTGSDSLNWGDPGSWAHAIWFRCLAQHNADFVCLCKYGDLRATLLDWRVDFLGLTAVFRRPGLVKDYLREHAILLETLPSALSAIGRAFGFETRVEFDIASDPESVGSDTLFAYISCALEPEDALHLIDRFDSEWYLSQPRDVLELFNVALELT